MTPQPQASGADTVKPPVPDVLPKLWELADSENLQPELLPSIQTVIACDELAPLTTMLASLFPAWLFDRAENWTRYGPTPLPPAGDVTVNHVVSVETTCHAQPLPVPTEKLLLPPVYGKVATVGFTV